jgi:hypothetical protein
MDSIMTDNLLIGIFAIFLLILLMYLKKNDPMVGCEKWRRKGCDKISGADCTYPDCETLKKYLSGRVDL